MISYLVLTLLDLVVVVFCFVVPFLSIRRMLRDVIHRTQKHKKQQHPKHRKTPAPQNVTNAF